MRLSIVITFAQILTARNSGKCCGPSEPEFIRNLNNPDFVNPAQGQAGSLNPNADGQSNRIDQYSNMRDRMRNNPQTPDTNLQQLYPMGPNPASLDELPQLLNAIKGEMSLVGPRPEMPFIVAEYKTRHWQRLRVKPGITGLWQLSADRAFLIHENLDYDLYYMRNRGFFMDIAILLHTFFFAMRGI